MSARVRVVGAVANAIPPPHSKVYPPPPNAVAVIGGAIPGYDTSSDSPVASGRIKP